MNNSAGRQTIFALSSGKLPAGVAVIRMSGPDCRDVVAAMAGGVPSARRAVLRPIIALDGRHIDTALVLWFPGPASFTGEDCVEFQCHGGLAVVAALMADLAARNGFRMAEPGEFSLRAFINGKSDLTEMEALADLIDAETESQRALAVAGASGAQRQLYDGWRGELLSARACLEADLDFADEDHVPGSVADTATVIVEQLIEGLEAHLETKRAAEIIRDGFRVVIAGAPNAGKSTLLNTLACRDVAIVTDIAGTTRDVLDVFLDIGGVKIILSDTAGLRETADKVETIGIERAYSAIESADLVLMLSDGDTELVDVAVPVWLVRTKVDEEVVFDNRQSATKFDYAISSTTGQGIDVLVADIGAFAQQSVGRYREGILVTRARHVALLENALAAMKRFSAARSIAVEFAAEELRIAADALGQITGIISTEDVLGAIFSSFCIGK